MTDKVKFSLLERFLGVSLFLTLAITGAVLFISSVLSSISEIISESSVLNFNKGIMYMLGGSIGLFSLFIGVAYHSIYLRKIPEKTEKVLVKGAVIGILIMFLFPQLSHFGINRLMINREYIECSQAKYSWLFYKKYVYTKNQLICQDLVTEITKSSSGR